MIDPNVNEPAPVKAAAEPDKAPAEPVEAPTASVEADVASAAPAEDAPEQGAPSIGQKLAQAVASIKTVFTGPAK